MSSFIANYNSNLRRNLTDFALYIVSQRRRSAQPLLTLACYVFSHVPALAFDDQSNHSLFYSVLFANFVKSTRLYTRQDPIQDTWKFAGVGTGQRYVDDGDTFVPISIRMQNIFHLLL
jgi:hypothetical protein